MGYEAAGCGVNSMEGEGGEEGGAEETGVAEG